MKIYHINILALVACCLFEFIHVWNFIDYLSIALDYGVEGTPIVSYTSISIGWGLFIFVIASLLRYSKRLDQMFGNH